MKAFSFGLIERWVVLGVIKYLLNDCQAKMYTNQFLWC